VQLVACQWLPSAILHIATYVQTVHMCQQSPSVCIARIHVACSPGEQVQQPKLMCRLGALVDKSTALA
jgi:hypothetical protein